MTAGTRARALSPRRQSGDAREAAPSAGDAREPVWTGALAVLLLASCVVVPVVFTTRIDAVFVVPKLAVLWALLALSLGLVAAGTLLTAARPAGVRVLPVVDLAVAAFVALTVLAWAFSSDREQSLYGERLQYQGLLTTLLYVGLFYVARLAFPVERRFRLLFPAVAIGASLVAGYALVQRAGLDPVWDGFLPSGRVFSSIGQPNALAAYLVLALPLCVPLLFDRRAPVRVGAAAAIVAIGAALVFTVSRGGFLGLLAALAVLVVGLRSRLRIRAARLLGLAAAATAAIAAVVVVNGAIGGDLTEPFERVPESVQFHLDAWRVAAAIAVDHPVLGTGPETFPDVFPRYSHDVLSPERAEALDAFRVESPHNVYLGIAAGSGVPALLAYLGVLGAFVVVVARAAGSAEPRVVVALVAVLAATAGHLVTDGFMTADVAGTSLFWILMGATLSFVSAGSGARG